MKKLHGLLFIVSMLSVLVVSAVQAETGSVPGGGWWSGEMVQNVGTGDATVVVTAYGAGSEYATSHVILAPFAATNFLPSDFALMSDGFQGAAVVQADQPIKAIVNVTNRPAGSYGVTGGEAAAQYQGVDGSAVADHLYFPLVKNDYYGKTTSFYIQNAGTTAAAANYTFSMDNGSTYTCATPSIPPTEMVVIVPLDCVPPSVTGVIGKGSLQVWSSTTDFAGVVMEYYTGQSPALLLQATRGFTAQDFDTTRYAPTTKQNFYNRFTGIQVQNVDTGNINITISYVGSQGACNGVSLPPSSFNNLAPGKSHTFNQIAGQDGATMDNCLASATIVATGDIVATVNESFTGAFVGMGNKQASTTYSTFADSAKTTKISVPLYKEDSYQKYTGLLVQNVGSSTATNIQIEFKCTATVGTVCTTYKTNPITVLPGSNIELSNASYSKPASFWQASSAPVVGTVYAVNVTSDQPVVAIVNESVHPSHLATLTQDKNNYEGFNLP
jgi:hypothetical protein